MMHHEAGVRAVTVGGRPTTGPMQAATGSRGARYMSLGTLDANIMDVEDGLASEGRRRAASSPTAPRPTTSTSSTRGSTCAQGDQVRRGEDAPLQFAYDAADCRIFWTPRPVFNYSALWQYAADAAWKNSALCVAGPAGFASSTTLEPGHLQDPAGSGASSTASSSAGSSFGIDTYLSALAPNAAAADEMDVTSSLYDGLKKKRSPSISAAQIHCNATTPCRDSYQVCREVQLFRGSPRSRHVWTYAMVESRRVVATGPAVRLW